MNYFIQTQPAPDEGAHAQEVARDVFLAEALNHPYHPIECEDGGMFLRLDLPEREVV